MIGHPIIGCLNYLGPELTDNFIKVRINLKHLVFLCRLMNSEKLQRRMF